jgi:hypothetical protein
VIWASRRNGTLSVSTMRGDIFIQSGIGTLLFQEGPGVSSDLLLALAFYLQNHTFPSGRCWDRTSDLCRVKAATLFLMRPNV